VWWPDVEWLQLISVDPQQIVDHAGSVDSPLESGSGTRHRSAPINQCDDMVIRWHFGREALVERSDELPQESRTKVIQFDTDLFTNFPSKSLFQRFSMVDMAPGEEVPAAVRTGRTLVSGSHEEDLVVSLDRCPDGESGASRATIPRIHWGLLGLILHPGSPLEPAGEGV
jgi:hypothetical protein